MELKKLIEIVTVLGGLLDDLLAVLERETAEMGAINVTAMADSNRDKEELVRKISEQDSVLKRAVSNLAVREGLAADTSLGALAELLGKKGSRELRVKQQHLKVTANKIQQAAALNREIAERFASTVSTTLTLIARLTSQSNVYGSSGGYQQPRTGAVMINMEA